MADPSKREKIHLAYGPALLTAVVAVLIAIWTINATAGSNQPPTPLETMPGTSVKPVEPSPSTPMPTPLNPDPSVATPQALTLDNAAETNSCAPSGNSGSSWKDANPKFLNKSYADGMSCRFGFDRPIEGSLEFMVDANKKKFKAIAGIDDSSENTSPQVRFTAYDATTGSVLQTFDVSYKKPEQFDVNIEGVQRLGLRVESLTAPESLWDAPAIIAWAEPAVE